ncbi:MAG: Maf family protein [Verrucomicrobiota bacterium]
MKLPSLILASASPRRAQLLRELELEFQVVPGNAPEADYQHMTPRELCQLNAYRKARVVAKRFPDALVLGADTEVALGARIFGKPANLAEAQRFLTELQGKTHEVVTGVCLAHLRWHRVQLFAVGTKVTFRKLTLAEIDAYLQHIQPLDKAGAYAIQEHGELIIKKITGSYSNVVGLPVERLIQELRKFARR